MSGQDQADLKLTLKDKGKRQKLELIPDHLTIPLPPFDFIIIFKPGQTFAILIQSLTVSSSPSICILLSHLMFKLGEGGERSGKVNVNQEGLCICTVPGIIQSTQNEAPGPTSNK